MKKKTSSANYFWKKVKGITKASIYTEISADQRGKIEATKKIFDKIIRQVPDTPKKRINIQYDEKNNSYNIEEEWI